VELTDRQISQTPCGLVHVNGSIVGRFNRVNGVMGYECLVNLSPIGGFGLCKRNDFRSKNEMIDHLKMVHGIEVPDR